MGRAYIVRGDIMDKVKRKRKKLTMFDVINVLLLTLFAIIILLPFYNAVMISFMTEAEYVQHKFALFPKEPTLSAYKSIFETGSLANAYKSTLTIVFVGLIYSMTLTTLGAFVLSREDFWGKKLMLHFVIVPMFFSGGMIPFYLLIKNLNLIDTLWSVILPSGISTFYMLLMRNFFESIPKSLEESARLDGASELKLLIYIVLPLSMPIIATIVLFTTVGLWNEWYKPMLFLNKTSLHPLQLVLKNKLASVNTNINVQALEGIVVYAEGIKMAQVVVTMVPIMLLYPFLQKYYVKGIMVGAVKG